MIKLAVHTQELTELCRRHGVQELSVFGSVARGTAGPGSDIDILVVFEPSVRPGFISLGRLTRELEKLLGRRVDLVPKNGLKPRIRDRVLAEAEVLFSA